jgi:hypothetical protein
VNIIRKIAVGPDYMNCMNYTVGQPVLNKQYVIHDIKVNSDGYQVWIKKDDEIVCWKNFSISMPVSLEYKIDF